MINCLAVMFIKYYIYYILEREVLHWILSEGGIHQA